MQVNLPNLLRWFYKKLLQYAICISKFIGNKYIPIISPSALTWYNLCL